MYIYHSYIQQISSLFEPDFGVSPHLTQTPTTVRGKYLEGENMGEFGKFVAICQIFTLQMS